MALWVACTQTNLSSRKHGWRNLMAMGNRPVRGFSGRLTRTLDGRSSARAFLG